MALSGLEIYKLLPKTNCRECGFPTCLAFALALAKKSVVLDKCPHVSQKSKQALEAQSQPPIKLISIGSDKNKVEIGNETVMFRHEEKFHHPCAIGFIVEDSLSGQEIKSRIDKINKMQFERVGQLLKTDIIAIKQTQSPARFLEAVKLASGLTDMAVALIIQDTQPLKEALGLLKGRRPLVYSADKNNLADICAILKDSDASLAVRSDTIEELAELTIRAKESGVENLVLNVNLNPSGSKIIWDLTQLRRNALKKSNRAVGYPIITIMEKSDVYDELVQAGDCIAKYSGIVLLNTIEEWAVLSLLTLRQNIYTDPQKPLQIEPKLYSIGNTTENSPALITTNFSLSYYTVLGEVEASKVPAYILSIDTEGMSVLTAWAAEKFTAEKIDESMRKFALESKLKHRNLIIPGYVAVLSGELEDKSGWKIMVGPKEAAGLPSFLKNISYQ